jgi:hypothetical protein
MLDRIPPPPLLQLISLLHEWYESSFHDMLTRHRYDVEAYAYEALVALRCAPWFAGYVAVRPACSHVRGMLPRTWRIPLQLSCGAASHDVRHMPTLCSDARVCVWLCGPPPATTQVRTRLHDEAQSELAPLEGFHGVPYYINFRIFYRWPCACAWHGGFQAATCACRC